MENPRRTASDLLGVLTGTGALPIEQQMSQLSTLVEHLDESGPQPPSPSAVSYENRLVEVRLGIASGLFTALRSKHAPTAAHCLRVALGCSAWSIALNLSETETDQLEVAALLHDVGKIGVPDSILLKPGILLPDEVAMMNRHRMASLDILRSCCASSEILDIVQHGSAWFDGSRNKHLRSGRDIPLGARMLAIVDAFDSMTTDQVYRRAMSNELALSELFKYAGTQFDPDLVKVFSELHDRDKFHNKVTQRWLRELDPRLANSLWQANPVAPRSSDLTPLSIFQDKLLDNMHDAVIFIDRGLHIVLWNRGAERLTGIGAASVFQHLWHPSLIGLQDEKGHDLEDEECPVMGAINSGAQSLRRMLIKGRNGAKVAVDVHTVPVVGSDGLTHGAATVLHDASPEASLEQRCQRLHERATKDPLTQVANRAEFDRTHKLFVAAHLQRKLPCSLIICDIDRFKHVNDTYGHQAGDEVLRSFAQVLKGFCRPGDLVARYGGEEFVVLCADCNNATAAQRADQIRLAISSVQQVTLGGRSVTVSFGVTEVQPGDTPDSMLRRADRALLEAKHRGRNTVVQLGSGIGETDEVAPRRLWFFGRSTPSVVMEKRLVTSVPLNVAIEKLRGFVADHFAEITLAEPEVVHLKIDSQRTSVQRRTADRPVPFLVELQFAEQRHETTNQHGQPSGHSLRTKVSVVIRPKRDRDRRRGDMIERARQVMASIKSYLIATEEGAEPEIGSKS